MWRTGCNNVFNIFIYNYFTGLSESKFIPAFARIGDKEISTDEPRYFIFYSTLITVGKACRRDLFLIIFINPEIVCCPGFINF
jgi:hypothetical protein